MTPDRDFIAAMQKGIPPIHPDPIADDESEHGICAMGEISESQMAEGHVTEERR